MKRTILSLLVALIGVTGAWALDNVPYVDMVVTTDANGNVTVTPVTKYANNVTVVSNSFDRVTWNAGWYVVTGNVTLTNGATCHGAVHLILADGAKLTSGGAVGNGNINVLGTHSLTIYGQVNQTGELEAKGTNNHSGIGGGHDQGGNNITINGGIVTATGGQYAAGIGGGDGGYTASDIIINGGVVTATGGENGAGIGGGYGAHGRDITINGGRVTATGGWYGAGIGGGSIDERLSHDSNGWNIHINGGEVSATSPKGAAGIGGGSGSFGHAIVIRGGVVRAQGGSSSAGIGGGASRDGLNITIYGGDVTAIGGEGGAGIGSGGYNRWWWPWEKFQGRDISINGGHVRAIGGDNAAGIGGGSMAAGWDLTISGGVVIATGGINGAGIGGGNRLNEDGTEIFVPDNSGEGNLIVISGGEVTATGGENAAGIGGGNHGKAYSIRLYDGHVTASGGENAPSIGSGYNGASAYSIYVDAMFIMYADNTNPPMLPFFIPHNMDTDIATNLSSKRYLIANPLPPLSITLDMCGGHDGSTNVTATYGHAMPEITLPARTGCVFSGYFSEPNGAGTKYYNADGTSAHDWDQFLDATLYAQWEITPVQYVDAQGNIQTIDNITAVTSSETRVTWTAGWYVVLEDVRLKDGATCSGDVHLILADGATLTSRKDSYGYDGCIQVSATSIGNSLTIYGQEGQTGKLIAYGDNRSAGIGGKDVEDGGNIIINGGIIEAHGGKDAAGIGGGESRSGRNITINRGSVTATGGSYAAGIGGGNHGGAEFIRINGGNVLAEGGFDSLGEGNIMPGIGAGLDGTANNIFVDASLAIRADNNNPPTSLIGNHSKTTDIAVDLSDKMYAAIEPGVVVATRFAADKEANFGTYYDGTQAYEVATADVTLYTASLTTSGSETYLILHEIEGNILPTGTAVVVRSETEENVLLAPYAGSTEDVTIPDNDLRGVDVDTETTTLGEGSLYILSAQVLNGVTTTGFYRYMGETMPAHKAYLQIAPGALAPTRIVWGNRPVPTEIENVSGNENANENANANKVLRDGALYIIKGTRVYNAQGVLVE